LLIPDETSKASAVAIGPRVTAIVVGNTIRGRRRRSQIRAALADS
jgi:hypothetical protein